MDERTANSRIPLLARFLSRYDVHMQEVLRGASAALVLKIIGAALTFAMTVAVGRMLGAEGAGIFFLALSVVTIASVLGKVGMDNTLLRFTAAHASAGKWGQVKGVARLGLRVAAIALVVATAVVLLTAPFLADVVFRDPALTTPLRIMALAILPLGMFQLLAQLLRGLKRVANSVLVQSVWLPALMLLGLFVLVPRTGVIGAIIAYVGATCVTMLVGCFLWRRRPGHEAVADEVERKAVFASSKPLYAAAAMQLVLVWGSTLILGAFRSSEEVGIYSAANRTAMLLSFVLMAVNTISAPKFAAMYREGDLVALGRLARGSAKLMALVTLPGLMLLVTFPRFVLGIFGPEFSAGWVALIILAVGQYVNVVTGSVGYLLMMTGNERLFRNAFALTLLVNVILNISLVPVYGLVGAAAASAAALSVQNLLAAVLVRKHLGIWTLPGMRSSKS